MLPDVLMVSAMHAITAGVHERSCKLLVLFAECYMLPQYRESEKKQGLASGV